MRISKRCAYAALTLVALAAAGFAAKFTITSSDLVQLPGVDANGNLDGGNTGGALLSLTINTKNGKTRLLGGGLVPNESNSKQTYKDAAELATVLFGSPNPMGIQIKKMLYKVAVSGSASLKGSLVVDLNQLFNP